MFAAPLSSLSKLKKKKKSCDLDKYLEEKLQQVGTLQSDVLVQNWFLCSTAGVA